MMSEIAVLEQEIAAGKSALSDNIHQLQDKAHALVDWRAPIVQHPWDAIGLAIIAGGLIGLSGHARRAKKSSGVPRTGAPAKRDHGTAPERGVAPARNVALARDTAPEHGPRSDHGGWSDHGAPSDFGATPRLMVLRALEALGTMASTHVLSSLRHPAEPHTAEHA